MSYDGFQEASKMITLLAATRLIPREPALVDIINKRPLEQRKVAGFQYFGKQQLFPCCCVTMELSVHCNNLETSLKYCIKHKTDADFPRTTLLAKHTLLEI